MQSRLGWLLWMVACAQDPEAETNPLGASSADANRNGPGWENAHPNQGNGPCNQGNGTCNQGGCDDDDDQGEDQDQDPDEDDCDQDQPNNGPQVDFHVFTNLKLDYSRAQVYYAGGPPADDARREDTLITFEVIPGNGVHLLDAKLDPMQSEPYLNGATIGAQAWSATSYHLLSSPDGRFQNWAFPHVLPEAGDKFQAAVQTDQGNFEIGATLFEVFVMPPYIKKIGAPGNPFPYNGGTVPFATGLPLEIQFLPPLDADSQLMLGYAYAVEVFAIDDAGQQIAHFREDYPHPTPVDFLGTLSVVVPSELFPAEVQTPNGPVEVFDYKLDLAIQSNGNNAAIMIPFERY